MPLPTKDEEETMLERERDRLLAEKRKAELRRQISDLQDPTGGYTYHGWPVIRDRPELSMSEASKQVFTV